jgi:undecaprenol kinase
MLTDSNENKQKKYKNRTFLGSFEFAITGIKTAFHDECNMRKHFLMGILVVIAGFIFKISLKEWLWVLAAIFFVIVMEVLNSVAETIVDLATNYHYHPLAKKAKDMAAGAVLLASILAIIIGLIIFLPRFWQLF